MPLRRWLWGEARNTALDSDADLDDDGLELDWYSWIALRNEPSNPAQPSPSGDEPGHARYVLQVSCSSPSLDLTLGDRSIRRKDLGCRPANPEVQQGDSGFYGGHEELGIHKDVWDALQGGHAGRFEGNSRRTTSYWRAALYWSTKLGLQRLQY